MQRQLTMQQHRGKCLEVSAKLQCHQDICDYNNRQSSSQPLEQSTIYVNTCSRSVFSNGRHCNTPQCSSDKQRNNQCLEEFQLQVDHTFDTEF